MLFREHEFMRLADDGCWDLSVDQHYFLRKQSHLSSSYARTSVSMQRELSAQPAAFEDAVIEMSDSSESETTADSMPGLVTPR